MTHNDRRSGENISLIHPDPRASSKSIGKEVVVGWLNPSDHRESLLVTGWTKQEIGVYATQDGGLYTTQNFY